MTLYLIGIGLSTEKDITVQGLEFVRNSDLIYLENYTSVLQCSKEQLENYYGKKILLADRERSEQGMEKIIEEARKKKVSYLVIGDPFSATTHIEIFRLAQEKKVKVKVINNASIITAVGITGLQLYKFGKIISIPFLEEHPQLETPYQAIKENEKLHTLCLLDLKPAEGKFIQIKEALEILETIEQRKKEKIIHPDLVVIGCARLGSDDFVIKVGKLKDVKNYNFGQPPYCLIIPGKLHFLEEEMLKIWS